MVRYKTPKTLAKALRSLGAHGSVEEILSEEQGWQKRLDEIQAAILRVKLAIWTPGT